MHRDKQMSFPEFKHLNRLAHGGSLNAGKRKQRRPLDPKRSIHLVLRSTRAKGPWSLKRFEIKIRSLLYREASRRNVKIYQYANSGNHLHLLLKARTLLGFQQFLKTTSGLIARLVT